MTDAQVAAQLRHDGRPEVVLCHGAPDHTVLAWRQADGGLAVHRLDVGPQALVDTVMRHRPPTPGELEHAIDRIEDTIGRLPALPPTDRALRATGAFQRVVDCVADRRRESVEALFQRLASVSLGHPAAGVGLPDDTLFAAAALLLRECVHHLGFESLD